PTLDPTTISAPSLHDALPIYSQQHENGDLFCAERASAYGDDPLIKLQAAVELAARSLTEQLQSRACLTSPGAVRDLLRLKLAGRSEEHTSELQSRVDLVCRLL